MPSSVSGIRTPNLPLLPVWEKGAGGMRGKRRGNAAHRASRPRTPPLRAITGARASPPARSVAPPWVRGRPARMVRGRPRPQQRCAPSQADRGEVFGEAPACHLPFQASGRPTSPFSPCGRRGQGGMRGKRRGNAAHRASRSRTPPLRAITGARARRHTRSRSAWVRGRPARMVRGRGAIPVPSERATTHRSAQDARR